MENYVPVNEILYVEKMELQQKIKEMGFEHVFLRFSYFREIKDPNFHRLRCDFIKSCLSRPLKTEIVKMTKKLLEDYIDPNKTILTLKDIEVKRDFNPGVAVAASKDLTVAIDTQVDEELEDEMYRNDIASEIQRIRKENDCSIGQTVNLVIKTGSERIVNVVKKFENFIKSECFVDEIRTQFDENVLNEWEINLYHE